MNRFSKLLNFELNRFMKIYLFLVGLTVFSQVIGAIVMSKGFVKMANDEMFSYGMSEVGFVESYGFMTVVKMFNSVWFMLPIVLSIGGLVFYMLLIWYRDWFGKNTFIYRLLMIPTARLNVFLAKAMAIMVMVIGLVAVQLMLLPVISKLLTMFVPSNLRLDYPVTELILRIEFLQIVIPETFTQFILHYGMGFMVVVVLFTIILFERSYRLIGVVVGGLYGLFTMILFLSPQLVQTIVGKQLLHPIELFLLQVIIVLLIISGSIWMSRFLLNNKVRV